MLNTKELALLVNLEEPQLVHELLLLGAVKPVRGASEMLKQNFWEFIFRMKPRYKSGPLLGYEFVKRTVRTSTRFDILTKEHFAFWKERAGQTHNVDLILARDFKVVTLDNLVILYCTKQ